MGGNTKMKKRFLKDSKIINKIEKQDQKIIKLDEYPAFSY